MILISLAIMIGLCFIVTILLDHKSGIGFIFLASAFFWLAFVDVLSLYDKGYDIVVFRLAFFKFMCLIGSSVIAYEKVREWNKKRNHNGKV